MRKGRSSRRSRSSRPLVSGAPRSSVDVLSAEAAVDAPRVVVGMSDSEPPTGGGSEAIPPPPVEAKGVTETPAIGATTFSDTIVDKPRPEIGSGASAVPDSERKTASARLASTLVFGSSHDMADESKPVLPEQPVKVVEDPLPAPKRASADTVEKVENADTKNKKNKKDKKKKADEIAKAAGSVEGDEISVPPVGDLAIDEKFFSDGDVSRHLAQETEVIEGDALTVPDTMTRKSMPYAVERRARFSRYVKWAVAGAAVVCVAALARTAFSPKAPVTALRNSATTVAEPPPAAEPKAAPPAVAAKAEETPTPTTSTGPAAAASAATIAPATADPTPSVSATTAAPAEPAPSAATTLEAKPEDVTGNAKDEKKKAVSFLEKRKLADAIEAGERSVKLDPTDGEAWLILGAAYQEKGNMTEARRAYASCVKEAKTGPRNECAKMLR